MPGLGATEKQFLYTPELNLMAEATVTGGQTAIDSEYLWFAGQPVAQFETATPAVHYYLTDHLGTPVLTTTATGNVDWRVEREPYGEAYTVRTGATRHQPLAFPGQEESGGEVRYNIFRWYRAGWGRYTQTDPVGLAGGNNLFEYAASNPLVYIDPSGMEALPIPPLRPPGKVCPFPSKPTAPNPSIGWRGGLIAILLNVLLDPGELNPASFENQRPGDKCDPCDEHRRCEELNRAVQDAKRFVGGLGACRAGMSHAELLLRRKAWLELATARARRDMSCWNGGDEGHQQAQANAWSHVGNCSKLLGM